MKQEQSDALVRSWYALLVYRRNAYKIKTASSGEAVSTMANKQLCYLLTTEIFMPNFLAISNSGMTLVAVNCELV